MGRILVVDDHADTCRVMMRLLRARGHEADCAYSGEEALARLGEGTPAVPPLPDVVLLDAMMPGVDGVEVLRRLRADPNTADVPVVMCSAVSDPAYMEHALAKGANDYLIKSKFDVDELLRRLGPYLERAG
jgi:two-component system, cell cycle response regulator